MKEITGEWIEEQTEKIYQSYKSSIVPFTPKIIYNELAGLINQHSNTYFFADKKRLNWCAERLNYLTYDDKCCEIKWTDGCGVWRVTQVKHDNDNKKSFRAVIDEAMSVEKLID